MFYSNNIVTPIHIYIYIYTCIHTNSWYKVCLKSFHYPQPFLSLIVLTVRHDSDIFCYWGCNSHYHLQKKEEQRKSVFVFFIEDLKCKYALSLTATDSLSFILFPVSVLRCIMWAVRFCDLILELKLYCLQNIFHTPANRLWRSNA